LAAVAGVLISVWFQKERNGMAGRRQVIDFEPFQRRKNHLERPEESV